jgi:hypothetical protein
MNKKSACLSPTFGNYKALVIKPVDESVQQINDFPLEYFAKKSIIKYGFFLYLG